MRLEQFFNSAGLRAIDVWREAGLLPSNGSEVLSGKYNPSYRFMEQVFRATDGKVPPNTWFPQLFEGIEDVPACLDFRSYIKAERVTAISVWRAASILPSYGSDVVNRRKPPSYKFMEAVCRHTRCIVQPDSWFPVVFEGRSEGVSSERGEFRS